MDITQLILDDHHEQRRLFAMLEQISRTDTEMLSALRGLRCLHRILGSARSALQPH